MIYFKKLFVLFQQRTKRFFGYPAVQRPNALENSLLANLPTELLQQIANDLPVVSAASFSLSCRQIQLLIGTQYLENLANSSDDTLAFLKLVEHDLPNQIVCNPCRKLHRIQDARKYIRRIHRDRLKGDPDCLRDDRKAMVEYYLHENFSTTVFKMVMKHHNLFGYDTRSRKLLNLLEEKLSTHRWGTAGTWIEKEKAECQIRNGSLFTCRIIALRSTCTVVKQDSIRFVICPHLALESRRGAASLRIKTTISCLYWVEKWSVLLHCKHRPNTKKRSWASEFQHCGSCRTECKAYFEHYDDCTIKFGITIWKDLGQGPEDEEWKAHLLREDPRSSPQPIQYGGELASVFQVKGTELSGPSNPI